LQYVQCPILILRLHISEHARIDDREVVAPHTDHAVPLYERAGRPHADRDAAVDAMARFVGGAEDDVWVRRGGAGAGGGAGGGVGGGIGFRAGWWTKCSEK
jgi:hypothetical protein